MRLKKVMAALCAVSVFASSMMIPETVHAAGSFTGTIDAFDMPSMEDTRLTPKPGPSDPNLQPVEDWNLAAGLEQSAFRASNEYEIQAGDIGYAWEAFDSNEGTRWQSGEKAAFEEEWIEADLGSGTHKLSNVKIVFFAKMYGNVVVETSASNGADAVWSEVGRLDIPSGADANIVKTVELTTPGEGEDPVRADVDRYVRLRFTSGNDNAANRSIAVKEIELNGVSKKDPVTETPDPTPEPEPEPEPEPTPEPAEPINLMQGENVSVTASATAAGYSADAVKDGNSDDATRAQRWQSGEGVGTWANVSLTADLGESSTLTGIKIYFDSKMYGNFELQTSETGDDETWETLTTTTDVPDGEVHYVYDKTFETALSAKRFVRLNFIDVHETAANKSIAIRELELMGNVATEETPTPEPAEPANLALEKGVEVSGTNGSFQASYAVDGTSDNTAERWQSGDRTTWESDVWIQVDLGKESTLTSLKIQFDRKMCGNNFRIETSATGGAEATDWATLDTVTDLTCGADVLYTKTFTESLETERFVRLYFTEGNPDAGNKSIAIRELELWGTQEEESGGESGGGESGGEPEVPPVVTMTAQEVLNKITRLDLDEPGTQVVFPSVPEGYEVTLKGSDLKQIISNDAIVTNYNFYDYDVDVLVQVVNTEDPTDRAEKNMILSVPSRVKEFYPELFPEVTNPNAEPKIIPSVQEWYGYNGDFVLSENTRIAVNDTHNLGLMKAAENLQADLEAFTGWKLAITTEAAGANDIELVSVESDKYDTGNEGYILLNNDNGLKIYSSTYRGVFYGTMSVEQVFYQQRYDGQYAFPKGIMRDYPKFEVRGYMLDVARAPYRLERLYDYAKLMGFYKMNEFHVHLNDNMNQGNKGDWNIAKTLEGQFRLESDTFPSLESVRKTSDYYNTSEAFGGQPQYTKEQYLAFQNYANEMGVDVMSEIDLPGHALLLNQYVEEFPEEAAAAGVMGPTRNLANAELLALEGANYENAKVLMSKLWDEYLGIEEDGSYNPAKAVFTGKYVDIGADEYWGIYSHNQNPDTEEQKTMQKNLLTYIQDISAKVEASGKKVRVWSQLKQSADKVVEHGTVEGFETKSLNNIVLDFWYNGYENVQQRIDEGFSFVVVNDSLLYGNPGRDFRDVVNAEYLFENWTPYITQTITIKKGEPGLLGAKTALWADINRMGVTERDINERVVRAASVVAEKTWGGTDEDQDYSEFSFKFSRLKNGPGVEVAKEIPSVTDLVLDYDFANIAAGKLYDISGNAYNATVAGGTVAAADGSTWMTFDGSTKITAPVDSLSYPYTVQFDVKSDNTGTGILFDGYDGRLSVDEDGNLIVDRSFFHERFEYQLPTGKATNITLVGTQQVTKLYVDGVFVDALIRPNGAEEDYNNLMGTFVFPLKNIGEGFHGQLANIKAYKKAMSPQEVKDSFENTAVTKVNVSQNAGVAGELRNGNGGYDNGDQKLHVAWKAIDGDGNTLNGTHAATESEKDSFFNGTLIADAYIALDFYRTRDISEVNLQFDQAPASYTLYTSEDGVNWTQLGGAYTEAKVTFAEPVTTQYLKLQGSGFKLREMEVYEAVTKTALDSKLAEAEALVEELGLSFADKKDKADFFDAYKNAVSVSGNAYAHQEDVDRALAELTAAFPTEPQECKHEKTELQNQKDATCTEEGYTGDTVCTNCEETIKTGEVIKALGHAMGEWKVVKEATATEDGLKERVCTREGCTFKESAVIPKTGEKPEEGKPEEGKPEEEKPSGGDSSSNSGSSSTPAQTDSPKTADTAPVAENLVLCFGALAILAGMAADRKKKVR